MSDGSAPAPDPVGSGPALKRLRVAEQGLLEGFRVPGRPGEYSNTNTVLLGLVLEQVTGKPIGELYSEQIIEPLGLKNTSFPDLADSSIPEPHAQGCTLQGQSDGEPADVTDWNPSWAWTAGSMISTVEDLLVYGRALGTGKGLLPPETQSERLDSFVSDVPPLNKPPLNGELGYGIGLANDNGPGTTASYPVTTPTSSTMLSSTRWW